MTKINWQAVFFDCDGVILDSVNVKTKAFAKMFERFGPEVAAAAVQYHLENGGISRYDKFRYYYENLLHQEITEAEVLKLGEEFSRLVVDNVVASPYKPGALETLDQLQAKGVPMYLVSGTPQEEMVEIAVRKGFAGYFEEIWGSPAKKWDIVADILARKGYDPQLSVFIGDAMSDFEAAQRNNMHFIGIVAPGTGSVFPPDTFTIDRVSLNGV